MLAIIIILLLYYLLLRKITTGISDIMVSLGNNISNFNKEIRYVGIALRARGEDPGNLLPQLFATYADCGSHNGPFTHYIKILENQYNDGTLKLESKYIINKSDVKYNYFKDKVKLKGNYKV